MFERVAVIEWRLQAVISAIYLVFSDLLVIVGYHECVCAPDSTTLGSWYDLHQRVPDGNQSIRSESEEMNTNTLELTVSKWTSACYREGLVRDAHLHGPFMAILCLVLSKERTIHMNELGFWKCMIDLHRVVTTQVQSILG